MSSVPGTPGAQGSAPASIWSIFDELAHLDQHAQFNESLFFDRPPGLEGCLRRVLRPHDEAGFVREQDNWIITIRKRLDDALVQLTYFEIAYELGLAEPAIPDDLNLNNLRTLFESESFLRYANAYLYFGVRFLADRPKWGSPRPRTDLLSSRDSNVRTFPLMYAPPVNPAAGTEELFRWITQTPAQDLMVRALNFLDDIRPQHEGSVQIDLQEPTEFELWLRGLFPEADEERQSRFAQIRQGLTAWALDHARFYLLLEQPAEHATRVMEGALQEGQEFPRPVQQHLKDPRIARFALADIYWIARLLCADVSSNGSVTYQKRSWLHLLRFRTVLERESEHSHGAVQSPPAQDPVWSAKTKEVRDLEDAEVVLRSVFEFVCDLIQNSVELTRDREKAERCDEQKKQPPSKVSIEWREVFDKELQEIELQRRVRRFRDPSMAPEISTPRGPAAEGEAPAADGSLKPDTTPPQPPMTGAPPGEPLEKRDNRGKKQPYWSMRVKTGARPHNVIGLAFSGGGIRSATFNLGVLQGLQELDLLRYIDYLSTVSGGGFIGSWLVGNVRRSAHWLGRLTDWSQSIAHLRSYSNYLAPRTGVLSADTYNLANSWLRNAFLIQLTGLTWLFVLLLATLEGMQIFRHLDQFPGFGTAPVSFSATAAFVMGVVALVTVLYSLDRAKGDIPRESKWFSKVRLLAVTPAWIGAFAMAAYLWSHAGLNAPGCACLPANSTYQGLLFSVWRPWLFLIVSTWIAFFIIAFQTMDRLRFLAPGISAACTLTLYLELVAIFLVLRSWASPDRGMHAALAFSFGPTSVLVAFGVSVLLLIGFTGRHTGEALREWWTRFGTWLGIFALIGVFLSAVAVLGPWLLLHESSTPGSSLRTIKWASVLSWLGTVLGGLVAGKSSKTTGEGGGTPWLEVVAKVGGLLFIVGIFVLGSSLLYLLLTNIFTFEDPFKANAVQVLADLSGWDIAIALALVTLLGLLFSWSFEINIFGFNQFYRNRIVRCYLGATRWTTGLRKPNSFTKFDFKDDLKLSRLRTDDREYTAVGQSVTADPYRGPFPIINCALNLAGSSDLTLNTRHSASFTLTPLHCGADREAVRYAPTRSEHGSFAGGVPLGQAVAISGAAVSSNMGYNTSPLVAFLLTMFNVRLGWWFPNPSQKSWNARGLNFSLLYLLLELFGIADEKRRYLNVSDGGHFENLGVYELVRRRCKVIIACDAECDEFLNFGSLGNMIRICETDFGAVIDMDVRSIRPEKDGFSLAHCAVGTIKYSNGDIGRLIYLKSSMSGDEDVSIIQYRASHPSFPHEATSNQFYSEDQFESYRKLGLHVLRQSFKGNVPGDDPVNIAERLADVLVPTSSSVDSFLKHSLALTQIWEKFRQTPALLPFMTELMTLGVAGAATPNDAEICIGLELIQLMENVFLDLRLDDFWDHPDNRGWAILFMRWARCPRFRKIWDMTRRTYGIRFEYFCNTRLNLKRDEPIVRV
jgi:hypothetical protein